MTLLILGVAAAVPVSHVILILHQADGSWQIQDADRIMFNQKEKLRVGVANKSDVHPDEYKKFELVQIPQAGVMRRHAGGYLVRKHGNAWDRFCPMGWG